MIEVDKGVEVVVVRMSCQDYSLLCDALTGGSFSSSPESDYQERFQQFFREILPVDLHPKVFRY